MRAVTILARISQTSFRDESASSSFEPLRIGETSLRLAKFAGMHHATVPVALHGESHVKHLVKHQVFDHEPGAAGESSARLITIIPWPAS